MADFAFYTTAVSVCRSFCVSHSSSATAAAAVAADDDDADDGERERTRARAHTYTHQPFMPHAYEFPNVPLNTYNAIYFSIPLRFSVLHMHETMIKIVCWLSFVFKFCVCFIYIKCYV